MTQAIYSGFLAKPDLGSLKTTPSEYLWLQNVRGRGGLGKKRPGIQTKATLTSGVMGIFDAYIDGDQTSLNRFIVWTHGGDIVLYYPTELITTFTYLFATGIPLYLQSPDLNWWSALPDTTTGIMTTTGVAAPSSSLSADLLVTQGSILGFSDSTGAWRLYTLTGVISTQRYAPVGSTTTYSTTQAFATGYGPVFEEATLSRFRLSVDNSGVLTTTQIA